MAAADNRFAVAAVKRTGPAPTPGSDHEVLRKYTLMMTTTLANQLDQDLLSIRRNLGRRADKSEVVRGLVEMLHDDPTVMAEVVDRLSRRTR